MTQKKTLKVFYDGGCKVCDAEMAQYRRIGRDTGVAFIDISDAGFSPEEYGKTGEEFMQALHVLDETGRFHTGVDAFRMLWSRLPGVHFRFLAGASGLPGINQLARLGYGLFAKNRHLLPKKGGKQEPGREDGPPPAGKND